MFLAILIVGSSNVLGLLRTSKDNISASQALQQRVERVKLATFSQVTDAQRFATEVLTEDTPSTVGLSAPVETFVFSPYPEKAGFVPVKVERAGGVTKVITSNPNLIKERVVRLDYRLTWSGFPNKRGRIREASILIAK